MKKETKRAKANDRNPIRKSFNAESAEEVFIALNVDLFFRDKTDLRSRKKEIEEKDY